MQQIIIPLKITNTASSAANDHCHNPSHHNQLYVYDYSIMYYCTNWSCQLPQICGSKSPKAMHFLWWLWWRKQSSKKQCLDHWTEYTHTSGMCTTQPLHFCAKKYIKKIQQILFASYPSICCCKLTNKAECSNSRYKDTNAIQWNSSNYTCCIETTGRQSNTYKTNIQVWLHYHCQLFLNYPKFRVPGQALCYWYCPHSMQYMVYVMIEC